MDKKAFWAIVLGATIGGSSGVFIKYMSISATSIAWIRTMVPALVAAGWMLWQGISFFRGSYKKMIAASLLNSFRLYLFLLAYVYTSIGNAVILFYSWPIFAALLGAFWLKEKLSTRQIILLILAFCGLVIAYSNKEFSFEDKDFTGMLAAMVSAVVYAVTIILFKSVSKEYSSTEMIFYQNFSGVFLFLPFFLSEWSGVLPLDLVLGTSYAILVGLIAFNLFFFGLKYLKASTASALAYMEVVSAILFGYFWFGEELNSTMIFGGGLIITSSFLLGREKAQHSKE